MRRFKKILPVLLTVCLLAASGACTTGALLLSPFADARMDPSLMSLPRSGEASVLYAYTPEGRAARTGDVHPAADGALPAPRRVFVPYDDMPQALIDAFVAIEDKRFFSHKGFDPIRTARAGLHYLTSSGRSFGGSTITQQLIKNLTGEDDYTVARKLTEIFEAAALENEYGKEEILEAYLNVINLGGGCYGVGAAAARYFSKSVSELTLSECACLAAVTNNPSRYDPLTQPENNRARRELILSEMARQGRITEEQRAAAVAEGVTLRPRAAAAGGVTGWYADLVISDVLRDLRTRCGMSTAEASRLVYGGGLSIYTVMDETLQTALAAYYAEPAHFPEGKNGRPQSACMIIDPMTGDVLAVAGAVGQKAGGRVQSYASDTRRPAGSTIKPLSVYAPSLKQGLITWATVLDDEPIPDILPDAGAAWPRNADGVYRGRVTVAEALARSVNTIPVRLLERLGPEASFSFLRDTLHVDSLRPPDAKSVNDLTVASLALGQQSGGVTLRELTGAYTIFAEGILHEPITYARVVAPDGRVLLENRTGGEAVLTRAEAAVMTRLLEGVTAADGTAGGLSLTPALGVETAGKTGTTQNNCDRWFIGMTPRLLGGVWVGYEYPRPLDGIAGNPAVRIWDEVFSRCEAAYTGAPAGTCFDDPPGVIRVTYCRRSGLLPTPACATDAPDDNLRTGWFVRGTEPTDFCREHTPASDTLPLPGTGPETETPSAPVTKQPRLPGAEPPSAPEEEPDVAPPTPSETAEEPQTETAPPREPFIHNPPDPGIESDSTTDKEGRRWHFRRQRQKRGAGRR